MLSSNTPLTPGGQAKVAKEVNKVLDKDGTKAVDKELVKELDEG